MKRHRVPDPQVESFVARQRTWQERLPEVLVLGRITGATAISAPAYRWQYTWDEAMIGPPPNYTPQTRVGAAGYEGLQSMVAISISELSNTPVPTTYSYGVPSVDLVGTFLPKMIPVGTYVLLTPVRDTDGLMFWLIINTQAISGTCP
jgi:hypothetical protein